MPKFQKTGIDHFSCYVFNLYKLVLFIVKSGLILPIHIRFEFILRSKC